MSGEGFSIGVHFDFRLLPGVHLGKLRFLEIRRHPDALQRHDHQQALSRLHHLPDLHLLARDHSVHRRHKRRVAQLQLGCLEVRLGLRHRRICRAGICRADIDLLEIRARVFERRLGLGHARARREHGGLADLDTPFCLRQSLLVGPQLALRHAFIRGKRVQLLLGNLFLLRQRYHPGEIRLGQLECGVLLLQLGMRVREVRGPRLLVRETRAREVGFRRGQLRLGVQIAAGRRLLRQRNADVRSLRLTFRHGHRRSLLVHLGLIIARINKHQHLAGLHRLVVVHQHLDHIARNLRGNWGEVPVHLRVVRALPRVEVHEQPRRGGKHQRASKRRGPAPLRIRPAFRQPLGFGSFQQRYFVEIFQSNFHFDAHESLTSRIAFPSVPSREPDPPAPG